MSSSHNNTLSDNNLSNSYEGISLSGSVNNTIKNNIANSVSYAVIQLASSNNNNISNNNFSQSGVRNWGILLRYSDSNIIKNNNASNTIIGGEFSNFNVLDSNFFKSNDESHHSSGISLSYSSNNIITNNFISNIGISNNAGISLYLSNNFTIIGNAIDSKSDGIYLKYSHNNTINTNSINDNRNYGIYLDSSIKNNIFNNFLNNTNNFYIADSANNWNTSKIIGKNIIDGLYLGGNFWANPHGTGFSQTCTDVDVDGICDSPYTLDSYNIDYLALTYNTAPPASVTNLTNITYASTYINWTWTNPLDPDYHHVMLYLNGTILGIVTAPQNYFNVTGLTQDTEYELGTLTVDNSGNISQTWVNRTARTAPGGSNIPPVADCGADKLKCENVGAPVQFNGSVSYDPDGAIISYDWDFGDNTNGTGAAPKHTYATHKWNGSAYQPFIVNLTVMDNDGLTNMTSALVTIWIAGDANGDGKVNILDASIIGLKWASTDPCADLNNDGKVNIIDASIIGFNWGKTT